ncbi:hypothetical protein [Mangrovimonas aestuarii]|uniref:hypothetical protein n=1 Tax=Mangrovimonas aestuarii TaxID=3018443 RepID=UPI00237890D6|nr:hypothetical protein [Mangrovimonas aestuarii]
MRTLLLVVVMLTFAGNVWAQIDSQEATIVIPAEDTNDPDNSPSIDIKPIENKGLSNVNKGTVNGLSVPNNSNLNTNKESFSMYSEKFADPGEQYMKRLKNHLPKSEEVERGAMGSTTNQYFGDVRSRSVFVNIVYRDHEYPDGDRIQVLVNDEIIHPNVLLMPDFRGFKLDLKSGFNKIDFLALNQGESGPNTAEFQVIDDNGNVISANRWNLSTGVKATVIVVKE